MVDLWTISELSFDPKNIRHEETVFTQGNGYLGTRGTFEEYYPGEQRTTFVHGVFDDVPIAFTELVNFPDWLDIEIIFDHERFVLSEGDILAYERRLDLHNGVLTRNLKWRSPRGHITDLKFERFASLADEHLTCLRLEIIPENYTGIVELRSGLNSAADNLGFKHWEWLEQGADERDCWMRLKTHTTKIEVGMAARYSMTSESVAEYHACDMHGRPMMTCLVQAQPGKSLRLEKMVAIHTSRDSSDPLASARATLVGLPEKAWETELQEHNRCWQKEWDRCDVVIEGDDEAQLALRFNIYHLLIAAPRKEEHVNIGAKTLSGYGYRGHSFWDTEIFMLPFFTYTRPEIARNLLSYRYHNLDGARKKATANGFKGAQFPWESAGDGLEVTPTWVPNPMDRRTLIRIWTGDIEIHISADIAFAVWQYWLVSQDDEFLAERGAEIIFETARFWESRLEWHSASETYQLTDVIGPDENHDHVDNNAYTNYMVRWHLRKAQWFGNWLKQRQSNVAEELFRRLGLTDKDFSNWARIADLIYCPMDEKTGLIEQFDGYFKRRDISLDSFEPRSESVQSLLGIEGANEIQIIKQPDVIMLMYLLPGEVEPVAARTNYDYYTARTDLTFGSSLGPAIQAIMAARLGSPEQAYENFMRTAQVDLKDVRGNSGDGIHGASAGGLWQAVVFGFGGLQVSEDGWHVNPRLPAHWKRLTFRFMWRGEEVNIDLKGDQERGG